jgi:NAD+ synthase
MKDMDYEIKRICNFIQHHILKTKSDGVIIALSGGLDSAVVAALSTKAIGVEKVHCYFLRYTFRSLNIDKIHTDALCNKFGLIYEENRVVSQSSKTSLFYQMIRHITDTIKPFIVNNKYLHLFFGNIDAKMRARYLYNKAHEHNCLILGTTNRSEQLIGYFIKFDECGCDLQPILHLYKTEVIELAKHLCIPEEIINRVPSADRWYGRYGLTYQKVDTILSELDKIGIDAQECKINDVTEKDVSDVITMVTRAKQKHNVSFPPHLECHQGFV